MAARHSANATAVKNDPTSQRIIPLQPALCILSAGLRVGG
jgi:hypothetical protein